MVKKLKVIIPLLLGVFLCWYAYNSFSKEQLEEIKGYIGRVDFFYVYIAIFLEFLSHISRGLRWGYMFAPMGYKPSKANMVMAVFIGYLVNLTIPRSGEVSRAVVVTEYDGVPFEKSFGTILSERFVDAVIGLLFVMLAFFVHYELIMDFIFSKISIEKILILGLVGVGLLVMFFYFSKKAKSGVWLRINNFLNGIKDGFLSIYNMENKLMFIIHTIFIWGCYFLMFYIVFFSLKETASVGISDVIVAFVVGSFAVAFTNGGFGAYPLFISEVLFVFGVPITAGTTIGWVLWASQTVVVLVFGGLSFLALPIFNKKEVIDIERIHK